MHKWMIYSLGICRFNYARFFFLAQLVIWVTIYLIDSDRFSFDGWSDGLKTLETWQEAKIMKLFIDYYSNEREWDEFWQHFTE